jgi:hypothetical protein
LLILQLFGLRLARVVPVALDFEGKNIYLMVAQMVVMVAMAVMYIFVVKKTLTL